MATPVLLDGRFDLNVATTASDGMDKLRKQGPFDAVIVDVRLPAGDDPDWKEFAQKNGGHGDPCLGLEILRQTLWRDPDHKKFVLMPLWARPNQFGVLTVENYWGQTRKCLEQCGVKLYKPKTADQGERILLDIIEDVLRLSHDS